MQDQFEPSLLVVAGFPRTGTTSIYRNLELHPGFAVPVRKELNFFCRPDQSIASYESHFPRDRQDRICVDVSPNYCLDPDVPSRLRAAAPHARVVLLLREPTAWIQSLYTQMCSFTPNSPSFVQFLEHPVLEQFNHRFQFSLRDGIYKHSLAAFGSVFEDNLLIIDFAAFEKNPLEILREIEEFAGAPAYFAADTVDVRPHNSSRLARRYPPRLRWLLSQEKLVGAASALVPARLLRRARSLLYYADGASQSPPEETPDHDHDVDMARDATAADQETYAELFGTTQFRRGSEFC